MKENEIRPAEYFQEYLRLSEADGQKLDHNKFTNINCVACGSDIAKKIIHKKNYTYDQCVDCKSVYCNPRPNEAQLYDLYSESPSSIYWTEVFFPKVKEVRRNKIFKPRAQRILDIINSNQLIVKKVCEVGAGHGLLLSELKNIKNDIETYAIEPDKRSAALCELSGIKTLITTSEKADVWHSNFDLVICSEVIEHVHSVESFVKSIYQLIKTDGSCLLTGLGYEGFDILTLQEKSNSLSPPHHLNFLSIKGIEKLFKKVGFSKVIITTPGQLDLDIVLNAGIDNEFLRVLSDRGEEAKKDFQSFLVKHNLSSHVWIFATK